MNIEFMPFNINFFGGFTSIYPLIWINYSRFNLFIIILDTVIKFIYEINYKKYCKLYGNYTLKYYIYPKIYNNSNYSEIVSNPPKIKHNTIYDTKTINNLLK